MSLPNEYQLSTTYLKLLLHEPDMQAMLESLTNGEYRHWFAQEFVAGKEIQPLFEAFADMGVSSWVLKFGDQLDSTTHGPLGFTALSAPNLRSALQVLADYSCIRTTAYRNTLQEDQHRLTLVACRQISSELVSRWLIEASMKVVQRLIENLMTHQIGDQASICFTHTKPAYADELDAFYGISCRYQQPQNSFSIPASWGQIASPLADTGAYQTNLAKCRELKLNLGLSSNWVDTINTKLDTFFHNCRIGTTRPEQLPTLDKIADDLAVSTRTLARRLREQNTSYKTLLESSRRAHAKDLLKTTHLRISDIADCLGYTETANFIRAFKSWENLSPNKWRRQTNSGITHNNS